MNTTTLQRVEQPYRAVNGTPSFNGVIPAENRAGLAAEYAFLETLGAFKLKYRLRERYERAYPELREIICYVFAEEEATANRLSPDFPHLILPDLVEMHMARLGLSILSDTAENELEATFFSATEPSWTSALGRAA